MKTSLYFAVMFLCLMATDTAFSIILEAFSSIGFAWCGNNGFSIFRLKSLLADTMDVFQSFVTVDGGTNSASIFKIELKRISLPMRIRRSLSYREMWPGVWITFRVFPIVSPTSNNTSVIMGPPFMSHEFFCYLISTITRYF